MLLTALLLISLLLGIDVTVLAHPALGLPPRGARRKRCQQSPHYVKGRFRNLSETPLSKGRPGKRSPRRRPSEPVEAVRTDLSQLDLSQDQVVWFGHSSYLVVLQGRKILVDPVLAASFPSLFLMRAFPGSDIYQPDDMPEVDLLIITHDHYDHLDYVTMRKLRSRVGRVVCPLGVGSHLERWGYSEEQIVEMDWDDTLSFDGIHITCLPARHFSGRSLKRNNTLWASFMVQAHKTLFLSGDGGYDSHFAHIGSRFPHIDLAILENGQYNEAWHHIHTMPHELLQEIHDLHPKAVLTVHHSKYALSTHPWDEPTRLLAEAQAHDPSLPLLHATIGQPLPF